MTSRLLFGKIESCKKIIIIWNCHLIRWWFHLNLTSETMKAIINLFRNLLITYKCYIYNRRNNARVRVISEAEYNRLRDWSKPMIYINN